MECLIRVVRVHGLIVDAAPVFAKPEVLVPGPDVVLEILTVALPGLEEWHLLVLPSRREKVLECYLALALLLDKGLAVLAFDTLVEPLGGLVPGLCVLFIAVLSIHHALWAHWLAEGKRSEHPIGLESVVLG